MTLTRRKLAAAMLVPTAAVLAQPQPAVPRNTDEEMKAARDRAKAAGDALAQQGVPMATEPAFQFRA
jgi:hypothetical protein